MQANRKKPNYGFNITPLSVAWFEDIPFHSHPQVMRALDSLDEFSDLTNGMKPGQSEIYNSSEHSAQIRMFQRLAFGNQDYSSSFFDQSQSIWRSRDSGDRSSLMPWHRQVWHFNFFNNLSCQIVEWLEIKTGL